MHALSAVQVSLDLQLPVGITDSQEAAGADQAMAASLPSSSPLTVHMHPCTAVQASLEIQLALGITNIQKQQV
jgi:hypothetical protein